MSASDSVWALVCGLPKRKREARLIMALKGFMDDSGSDMQSPHFVLAGFISSAKNWAEFADAWQEVCDQAPSIKYFKAAEAMGMRGQFGGWSRPDRDKKMEALSALIPKFAAIQICVHMQTQDFEETIRTLPIYNKQRELMHRHPYLLMWWTLLAKFFPQWLRMGNDQPVEFIFDRQLGFESEATALWESMSQMAQTELAPQFYKLLSSQPRFADDQQEIPLQAADLHAWAVRRELSTGDVHLKATEQTIENLATAAPMTLNITRAYLQHVRDRLLSEKES